MKRKQVDLWDEPVDAHPGDYFVLAGINKRTGRQLYLFTYKDCNDWSISVVPSAMSYDRAVKMTNKATKELENNKKLKMRYGEHEFTIIPADAKIP